MSTLTTTVTLVCLVAHQVGVVRDVPSDTIHTYPQAVVFPCTLNDNQGLDYYLREIKRQQDEECPRCYPNDTPWSHK
jgi:hypothetical protein